ncbi:unnamed protein product [Phyllotreta striolata]|uniref:Cytochrome b5 heme-binding domain-containing protein n=1 Tax=Phyllotreta striolata TaxID=444603 RepID=A0A9N9TJZ8_PHYSR|nr:unnamed protein product [Phyllotreta striolata]
MASKSKYAPVSSLGIKSTPTRGSSLTTDLWLEEKRELDGAEGLWRIHDDLYDLTGFVERHPGGSEWLELTKGTDITEAFEVHHLSTLPVEMLGKFRAGKAKIPRNSPFTFHENGFYRTLKREIIPLLGELPEQSVNNTNFMCDAMVAALLVLAILATVYWNFYLAILAGLVLGMLTIAAHNYVHMKDNFRMYYFQFSMLQIRDWRISHALSHHLLTNTIADLEITMVEPLLLYLPGAKTLKERAISVLVSPVLWLFFFHIPLIRRLTTAYKHDYKNIKLTDTTGLILPLLMYCLGGQSVFGAFLMWNVILMTGAFYMGFTGMNGAHHHPDIFHDGDTPRAKENYDWGLAQLDSIMEHKEVTGHHFLVLVNFGEHCLHHLFPTVDHGVLEHLYPAFERVLRRFDENLRFVTKWETLSGNFRQLVRTEPNPKAPELGKYDGRNDFIRGSGCLRRNSSGSGRASAS